MATVAVAMEIAMVEAMASGWVMDAALRVRATVENREVVAALVRAEIEVVARAAHRFYEECRRSQQTVAQIKRSMVHFSARHSFRV